jgi:hypothetical protein
VDVVNDLQLCNPANGMIEGAWLEQHNRLRTAAGYEPTDTPFPCTGGACYVIGEHFRCTSTVHTGVAPQPLAVVPLDALPERPKRDENPLPEDLERILRDPDFITEHDHALHFWLADYLRSHPDEHVNSRAYLGLWALYERATS